MMLRRILLVLFFALMIGGMSQRPAHAHYDDVHYTLNYYLARVIGYTPTQAHRMASLCYWIDYAPETEPTQIEHGVEALTSSKAVTVEALGTGLYRVLNALHITRLGNSIDPNKMNAEILDELDKLPGDVERLAKREDMRDVFEAQWRFHAFRDLYRFPESAVAGPDATAADAAIVEQHRLLWKEAFDLKNPGVFLHFFQDELPHSGYVVGGGHWVVPPGRKAVGGSTDWLSYYPEGVNQRTILETAKYMIEFMAKSSGGHQKPLISTPEGVLAHVQKTLSELMRVNPAPAPLKNILEVVQAKVLMKAHQRGEKGTPEEERRFGGHADGPNLDEARRVLSEAMQADGMTDVTIPQIYVPYVPAKSTTTSGAYVPGTDNCVLYGNLKVILQDAAPSNLSRVEIDLISVPSQRGERPALVGSTDIVAVGPKDLDGKTGNLILNLPIGEIKIEVRYFNRNKKQERAYSVLSRITKAADQIVINPESRNGKFVLKNVETDPTKKSGMPTEFNGRYVGTPTYGATSYQWNVSTKKPDGKPDVDFHASWSFDTPPSELKPGQVITLKALGAGSSANKTIQTSFTKIRATGIGFEQLSDRPVGFAGGETAYMGSGEHVVKITVPMKPNAREKAEIYYADASIYHYDWLWDKAEQVISPSIRLTPRDALSVRSGTGLGSRTVSDGTHSDPKTGTPSDPKIGNPGVGGSEGSGTGAGKKTPVLPPREKGDPPIVAPPGTLLNGWLSTPHGSATAKKTDPGEGDGYQVTIPAAMMGSHEAWKQTKLNGDFDVVFVYTLDLWNPAKDDSLLVELRLSATPDMQAESVARAGRRVRKFGDSFHFATVNGKEKTAFDVSTFGQLRLQRKGGFVTLSVLDIATSQWKELNSTEIGSQPAELYLGVLIQKAGESPVVIRIDSANVGK